MSEDRLRAHRHSQGPLREPSCPVACGCRRIRCDQDATLRADRSKTWPPQDVITYAAMLMGIEPPPEQDLETADLSPLARSFYAENKRASNHKLKDEFGMKLAFPNYRVGLKALWEAGEGRG